MYVPYYVVIPRFLARKFPVNCCHNTVQYEYCHNNTVLFN